MAPKPVVWMGATRDAVRSFPKSARRRVGHDLDLIQQGLEPADLKPMPGVGAGVYELRVRTQGAFRVFYVAKFSEAVYVLHAFQKKTEQTASLDVQVGANRYRTLLAQRRDR